MGFEMWIRTTLLLGILTGILLALGYLIGGPTGALYMLAFSLFLNFLSFWYSDKIVLSWYNARILTREEAPELYEIVDKLAERAGIPTPKVALIDSETPNAFATGRSPKNAVVAVTRGLLQILNKDEIEGVVGHEIGHIKNRDILINTITAAIAGTITYIAYWLPWIVMGERDEDNAVAALLAMILAPIASMIVQMAISRTREYLADETGAKLSGKPLALARALEKIERFVSYQPMREGNPATAHMFIINPFRGASLANLFSTHPPTQKRIERLMKLAEKMGVYR